MRKGIVDVLNFHFKHHRHGLAMPHSEHTPKFRFHGMYVGAGDKKKLSKTDLYHETDLRFWSKTNYKIGLPLNQQDPLDRPYIKQWNNIFTQVNNEYKKGTLTLFPTGTWESMTSTSPGPVTQPSQVVLQPNPLPALTPDNPDLANAHKDQADTHQAEADNNKAIAADHAQEAIKASEAGDMDKAQEHTDLSNAHNEKAEIHQDEADTHNKLAHAATILPENAKEAKSASLHAVQDDTNKKKYYGYGVLYPAPDIADADRLLTKHSDDKEEMVNWMATLKSDPKLMWAGIYDKKAGLLIGQTTPDLVVTSSPPPLESALIQLPPPMEEPKKSGGGAAIGAMLALGGGLLLATASAKGKR